MNKTLKVGFVAAALVATSSLANAGGIFEPAYSSIKDPGYVSMKDAVAEAEVTRCLAVGFGGFGNSLRRQNLRSCSHKCCRTAGFQHVATAKR